MEFPEADKDLEATVDFNEPDLDAITAEADNLDETDLLEVVRELDIEKGKSKMQQSQQSILKTRRDIEDYFEKKRLRQELDYLLEDNEK
jgi:hypothetical protein